MTTKFTRKEFIRLFGSTTAAAAGAYYFPAALGMQSASSAELPAKNIKWSYMDHWAMVSPRGVVSPYASMEYMDRYIRQLSVLGFTGFDTFAFRLNLLLGMFGSLQGFKSFIQDRGLEKMTSVFVSYPDAGKDHALFVRANHDRIVGECRAVMETCKGLGVENFVVQVGNTYWQSEPVTDEKIRAIADLWNRVGKMTLEYGVKLGCHHEFWAAISRASEIEKFYEWTDPQYVFYWCDTAQTVIAGLDPTMLYEKYHDRTSGFHFKDTHDIDTKGEYRLPPDPEIMAPSVERWFWEMGTPRGKVNFPSLMAALKKYNYRGWIAMEHDKVEVDNASYAEATSVAKWYVDNVLAKIYS